ncbi:MAG: trypsin-like peptidase domain-containing protein [Deltaproteobacteria bacterium]|nr:trypsin-like peptidase domain-containing protein [Deltaproteobacteria bacterium]
MLLSLLALAAEPDADPVKAPEDLPLDAVVLVLQGPATCAGAFVDDAGTVVTAYHCIAHGGRPRVTTRDGRRAVGRVVRTNVRMDQALILVPELAGGPVLPIREDSPLLGETVRAIGHPYGAREPAGFAEGTLRWSVSEGVVSAVGPRSIQITAPVNPGNSGGPVIDAEGRLVGVVSRRYGGDGLGFAGGASGVLDLMDGGGHGFGPLGGTLTLEALLSVWEGGLGSVAVGGRLDVALRDRLVFGVMATFPLSARWDVLRFDSAVRWSDFEGRIGIRQRVLRGMWTSYLEAYGGVASVHTLWPDPDNVFRAEVNPAPLVGGAVGISGSSVDIGFSWIEGTWSIRTLVTLRWPGTFWMF